MNLPRTSADTVTLSQWGELLREHGLRATSGRIATLDYLHSHPHSSVADAHGALAERMPSLTMQSVHNIAHDLTACGMLRRIDLPDTGSARYETRTGDNHHHVQCIVCHRIEDVDCVVGEAPCLVPGHAHGMRVLEAAVTFRGVCAECDTGSVDDIGSIDADADGAGKARSIDDDADATAGRRIADRPSPAA